MVDVMQQFVTRVDDDLAAAVDAMVEAGTVASRSDAVRQGLRLLADRHRRQQLAAEITAGYRAQPQDEREVAWSDASTRRMIADEPW